MIFIHPNYKPICNCIICFKSIQLPKLIKGITLSSLIIFRVNNHLSIFLIPSPPHTKTFTEFCLCWWRGRIRTLNYPSSIHCPWVLLLPNKSIYWYLITKIEFQKFFFRFVMNMISIKAIHFHVHRLMANFFSFKNINLTKK